MASLSRIFQLCLKAEYITVGGDASFAVRTLDHTLHILFQWSHGKTDWYNNLDFPAVPYRHMLDEWRCHRGFLRVWKNAAPYIDEILTQTTFDRINVTGYSHGGALAVLCHEYIWYRYPHFRRHLRGYGFGAPRTVWCTADCAGVAARWENFTVVRNEWDIVTYLPPSVLGYRHMGTVLEIGEKGRHTPLDAHRPENYMESLAAWESQTETE